MIMDALLDAGYDTIKLIPVLFLVYALIEYLEHRQDSEKYFHFMRESTKGPIWGSLLGCLPQCGFSVIGANLYSQGMIGVGTLMAIFIATSDEAIPILLAHPDKLSIVAMLLVIKLVLAMGIGVLLMLTVERKCEVITADGQIAELETHEMLPVTSEGSCGCHTHCHTKNSNIWQCAARHTAKILVFLFVITCLLNLLISWIGLERIGQLMLVDTLWQPALAALIGLIPNCAASIVLTEMYLAGSLTFGSLAAGLITGAGVGMVVLFKKNKSLRENLLILLGLYSIGTVIGMML